MDGGNPGGSSAGLFLPPGQGQVAGRLGSIVSPFAEQSTNALGAMGGVSPAQLAYPYVTGTTSNILNNPYQGGPIQGAFDALNIFRNQVTPYTFQAAPNLAGLADLSIGQTGNVLSAANNPAYGAAGAAGADLSGQLQGSVPQALSAGFNPAFGQATQYGINAAGTLGGAANSILGQSFDPQSALYNRTQQQVLDQSNAINAMNGLAGTPYGAGVTGQTDANFNIDWQNNQLSRQIQGGQAAQGLLGAGVSDIVNPASAQAAGAATGIGAGATGAQSALSSLLTPANNRIAAQLEGAQGLGSLGQLANLGYGGAIGDVNSLASGAQSFGAGPYNAYQGIQGNNFGALQNEIALGNQNYIVPNQTVNDINSYLNLGQSASSLANTIGSTNFNQTASALGGGASALFGNSLGNNGGLLGLAGLNPLSSAGGWGGSALGGANVAGAAGGSGFLDSLAASAPFAMSA